MPMNDGYKDPEQENEPRKPGATYIRKSYTLALVGALIFYLVGLYTHPLLFPTTTGAVSRQTPIAQQAPTESSDLSVVEAYQMVVQELNALAAKSCSDPQFDTMISSLAGEIAQLRTLNPYYRLREIQREVIPAGVSAVYGEDLGVSFDNVQASINLLREFDLTYGQRKISLAGADLERYIRTGSETACKYCCTAQTLVNKDGTAACGCDHSKAMRGLAAYLIANRSQEFSDEELLGELNRWRAVFFPKQTLIEALQAREVAGEEGIQEILEEFPEFMPEMVGGC